MKKYYDERNGKRADDRFQPDDAYQHGAAPRGRAEYGQERPNLGSARSDYGARAYGGRLDDTGLESGSARRDARSGRGSSYREDRGLVDRATDEVKSWFGDETAERRRRLDERADGSARERERSHGWRGGTRDRGYDWYEEGSVNRSSDRLTELRTGDVMTRSVVLVRPSDTLVNVARLMRECDCGAVPVVDFDNRLIGMITDRDITIRSVAYGEDPRQVRVQDCMTRETFACRPQDEIEDCLRMMSRQQIRRVPVVDDAYGVIGIVSQGDLARYAGEHHGHGNRRVLSDVLCAISEPSASSHR